MNMTDIQSFFDQMDKDMAETREMLRTEDNLIKAVKEYRKVWGSDPSKPIIIPPEL